jgi:hypothetical protein
VLQLLLNDGSRFLKLRNPSAHSLGKPEARSFADLAGDACCGQIPEYDAVGFG